MTVRPVSLVASLQRPPAEGLGRTASDVSKLGAEELDGLMGTEGARQVGLLLDWVARHARATDRPKEMVAELCERLIAIGLPLDRFGTSTQTLDAEHDAIGRTWTREGGVTEGTYLRSDNEDRYLKSPFFQTAQTREWLELWIQETDDTRFGIVAEFKERGFVHYLCVPLFLLSGSFAWLTFATRRPSGFGVPDIAMIARMVPTLGLFIDMRSTWFTLVKLLRTYVGDEPQQAILHGNTKRGQVSTIRSAMLFADMRDSVGHTVDLSAVAAVDVFNTLFDCLVPPIESRRGEVLKYIGDGLLAIFRENQADGSDAAERALAAAEEALRVLQARNLDHPDERPIHVGIALHYGEAAYGNVGSGVRLDFTVIGKDVGLASRIAGMNRTLGEPLLMSAAFVDRLASSGTCLGTFPARGFVEPVEVFRPEGRGSR